MITQLKLFTKSLISNYASVFLICPALFSYIFSNEVNIISLYGLVYRKLCLSKFNQTICDNIHDYKNYSNEIQEISSQKMIYLNISFLIPAIFSIIQLASIGDRKLNYQLPLLVSVIGSIGQSLICYFSVEPDTDLSLNLLFFSQFLNGICGGGSLAFISSCFSHISLYEKQNSPVDNSANGSFNDKINKNRSIRYSICESSLLIGQFLGSFSSGYIIGNKRNLSNFKNAYIISFSIYVFVLVYTIVMFQYLKRKQSSNSNTLSLSNPVFESVSEYTNSQRSLISSSEAEINFKPPTTIKQKVFKNMKKQFIFIPESWSLLTKKRPYNARFQILSLLLLYFLGASISLGIVSLQYLYLIKKPISLTQIDYGIFKAINTLFRAFSLLIILPILKNKFSISENVLYILGLTSELLNLVVFSLASVFKYAIWIGNYYSV